MEYRYTAIIIGKKDVGEADRIYTIYTKEAGKIQAQATGVRKPQAKLAGNLENFNLVDISIVKKNAIGRITSSITENSFPGLRKNIDSLFSAFQTFGYLERLIGLGEKDEVTFRLLLEYMETLDKIKKDNNGKPMLVSQGFLFKVLALLGYRIESEKCSVCGAMLKREINFFSPEHGGFICQQCAIPVKKTIKSGINTIKLARIFLANSLASLLKLEVDKNELKELEAILKNFIQWVAG